MKLIGNNEYAQLLNKIKELEEKVKLYEDDSGEATIAKIGILAKKCGINTSDDEYQDMMKRLFLSEAGKKSSILKAYSQTVFLKDNPQELLDRLKEMLDRNNVISGKQINYKKK